MEEVIHEFVRIVVHYYFREHFNISGLSRAYLLVFQTYQDRWIAGTVKQEMR
jgi:hypothetical protein